MYEEIKNNIIENFFNRNYKWTFGSKKQTIIANIKEHSIFPIDYDYNTDILSMYLGNDIIINFNLIWKTQTNNQSSVYKLITFN